MNQALIQVNDECVWQDNGDRFLTLPEEFFLLLLDEQKCRLPSTGIPLFFGLFGTSIAELLIQGKIGVQKPKKSPFNGKFDVNLIVLDPNPIQDDIFLSYVLEKIRKRPNRSIGVTINDLARGFHFASEKKVFKMVTTGLMNKGVLFNSSDQKSNLFGNKGYTWSDKSHKSLLERNCKILAHTDIKVNENFKLSDYVRELILLLTLKRYNAIIGQSQMDKFIKRNFQSTMEQKLVAQNVKNIQKQFQTFHYSDPIHKLLFWYTIGLREGFDSN